MNHHVASFSGMAVALLSLIGVLTAAASPASLVPGFTADANAPVRISAENTETDSNNADLALLSLSAGTLDPFFQSSTTTYTASVAFHVQSLTASAYVSDSNATIQIRVNGGAYLGVASGQPSAPLALNVGANAVDVFVTAQDGTTKTYAVTVTRATAVPGDVDFGFSPGDYLSVLTVAVQPDSKVLVGGFFSEIYGAPRNNLARLNTDGGVDSGFNPSVNSGVSSVVVQPDGRIMIGGSFTMVGGMPRRNLARLNTDGSLDEGFNPDPDSNVNAIALQADGKILIGGHFGSVGGVTRTFVARLSPDGTIDAGFNPLIFGFDVYTLAVQGDGKILIGGHLNSVGGVTRNGIARVHPDGVLDIDFDPGASYTVFSMALQADGKIVIGGGFASGGLGRNSLARLNANGTLDVGFVLDANSWVWGITPQADGRTVISGRFTEVGGVARNRIARFDEDGLLDMGFNPDADDEVRGVAIDAGGKLLPAGFFSAIGGASRSGIARLENDAATQALGIGNSRISWMRGGSAPEAQMVTFELSTDGGAVYVPLGHGARIVGGWELTGLALPESGTIRARAHVPSGGLNGSAGLMETVSAFSGLPTIDPGFGPDFDGVVFSTAVQPDGRIVVAGTFTMVNGQGRNRIARLNPDGTLDPGFNPDADSWVYNTLVQPDGKILLTGGFTSVGGVGRIGVARLNGDGTLDTGFNPDATGGWVTGMAVGADGKIVIVGAFTSVGGVTRNRIARLNVDGGLDTGFDPDADGTVFGAAVQADGKIVIGGSFHAVGGVTRNGIARLNADGTLDNAFNPNPNERVFSVALQSDGRIIIGGNFTTVSGVTRNSLARLETNGSLDMAFNPDTEPTPGSTALQADGKILLGGGFTTVGGVARNYMARLNVDGTLDAGFDPQPNGNVFSTAVQADGRILYGGTFATVGGVTRNRLVRLENDAASQSLSVSSVSRIEWLRGGTSPEAGEVRFDLTSDGGATYALLGLATRISGGWELTGLSLPQSGHIRARARTAGGLGNGSGGLVGTLVAFGGAASAPEIAVAGNNTNIANGDATPSMVDHTDFGSAPVGGGSVVRNFTITNRGTVSLSLGSVTVGGPDAGAFTITAQPFSPVQPDGSVTFQVSFDPALGERAATLSFINNDADEGSFTFGIRGLGVIPAISISDATLVEGDSGLTNAVFTLSLSVSSGQTITVTAQTSDLSANAGSDYTSTGPSTVTFSPFVTSQTFSVPVTGDTSLESDEVFQVTLSSPANATIADGVGVGTIMNDDGAPPSRVFVGPSGSDTNTCSLVATPCRNLNTAIGQVAIDGEVIVLSTAEYDTAPILIGKGVKITSPSGTLAFIRQPITVSAPGGRVILRGLTLKGAGAGDGITLTAADSFSLEDTTLDHWDFCLRIAVASGGQVTVTHSVFNSCGAGVLVEAGATAPVVSVEGSRFQTGAVGIIGVAEAAISVQDSTFLQHSVGISAATLTVIDIRRSDFFENATAVRSLTGGVIRVSRSHIFGNNLGLSTTGGGVIESAGNNLVRGNLTNTAGTIGTVLEQ